MSARIMRLRASLAPAGGFGCAATALTIGPPRPTRGPQQHRPARCGQIHQGSASYPSAIAALGFGRPVSAAFSPRHHPGSGTAPFRACGLREFRNSTVTCIKIPPTIAMLRFAAMILQYKYLKSELGATKKYGSK